MNKAKHSKRAPRKTLAQKMLQQVVNDAATGYDWTKGMKMPTKKTSKQAGRLKLRAAKRFGKKVQLELAGKPTEYFLDRRRTRDAQRNITGKPHFWVNCRVREDYHQGQAAAYILVHERSGRFFIGATASLYSHMQFQELALNGNVHYNAEVQRLYNQSPRFSLHYELIGANDSNGLNRLEAEELKQMWLAALATDPKLINSKADVIGYQAMGMPRPVKVGERVFPNVKAAARALGVAEKTVVNRCDKASKPEWRWM